MAFSMQIFRKNFRILGKSAVDGPLCFGTRNKTSESTAVPESTELTHGSIQEFPCRKE